MRGRGTAVAMTAFFLVITLIMIISGAGDTPEGRAAIGTTGGIAGVMVLVLLLVSKPRPPR